MSWHIELRVLFLSDYLPDRPIVGVFLGFNVFRKETFELVWPYFNL